MCVGKLKFAICVRISNHRNVIFLFVFVFEMDVNCDERLSRKGVLAPDKDLLVLGKYTPQKKFSTLIVTSYISGFCLKVIYK